LAFHSGREADHSPLSSAEVKEWVDLYLHSPIRLHGVVLSEGEHRDNFTFLPFRYSVMLLNAALLCAVVCQIPTVKNVTYHSRSVCADRM
jgi:hypothetical protein